MDRPLAEKRPIGPFVQVGGSQIEKLISEIDSIIGKEESLQNDYARIAKMLEDQGFEELSEQVRAMRADKAQNSQMLNNILSEVRRDTS